MDLRFALVVVAACSGNKAATKPVVDDARAPVAPTEADVKIDPSVKGDVQIRVEWKDVPADARAAPGRTTCGTARAAAVAPTTTWGIPEVFVALDGTGATTERTQRLVLANCALMPRVVLASGSLVIASATEQPAKLTIVKAGSLPLGSALKDDKSRDVYLPIAGHEVAVPVEANTIYRVTYAEDVAWVIATDSPLVAVTEGSGTVVMRGVQGGTHAVTAWLPPRAGQAARIAKGKVTVQNAALAEITLDLTKQ